jgi:hypothetical protein
MMFIRARVVMTFQVVTPSGTVVGELDNEAEARRLRDAIVSAMQRRESHGPKRTLRGRRALIPALVLYVLGWFVLFAWANSERDVYALDKGSCVVIALFWPLVGVAFAIAIACGVYGSVIEALRR